jgi:16S rRNA (cytidine1402-2'-O)-methyltransferase
MGPSDRRGALEVVATPIGNLGDVTPRALEVLRAADVIACEDTRRTGSLLSAMGVPKPRLVVVNAHTEQRATDGLIDAMEGGAVVALVTDAGTPGVSDPGATLVDRCHAVGIDVRGVAGPSAVTTAVSLSGFGGARFCFEGFLPRKGAERTARFDEFVVEQRSIVIFESPRRVVATLDDLAATLGAGRRVLVARELTKLYEEVLRGAIGDVAEEIRAAGARGEYVLVVEGGPPPAEATDDQILAALSAVLDAGGTRRDAVMEVSSVLGVARGRVYDLALTLP